ncbi:MAG TPA: class I SAM-dependent methyltransferase [Candidatus Dormibacteraeota bacterium]
MTRKHWEQESSNWAAWARRPDFDAYWKYSPTFFDLVPPAGDRTLEVGCGEGRVSRDLAAHGHHVVGIDGSPTLVRLACEADTRSSYLVADAAALPFATETFDLVVLYNSLMDVDDMDGCVRESCRVLRHGGSLCACVTHPMADAGQFESREPDAPFLIRGSYLGPRRAFDVEETRGDLHMNFKGWAYSLEEYFRPLERSGLMIQAVREPSLEPGTGTPSPSDERWRRIPGFLMWRAIKPPKAYFL